MLEVIVTDCIRFRVVDSTSIRFSPLTQSPSVVQLAKESVPPNLSLAVTDMSLLEFGVRFTLQNQILEPIARSA